MENQKKADRKIPKTCPFGHPQCTGSECVGWLDLADFDGCFLAAGMKTVEEAMAKFRESRHYEPVIKAARAIDAIKSGDKDRAQKAMEDALSAIIKTDIWGTIGALIGGDEEDA